MSTLLGTPKSAIVSLVVFSFFTNLLMLTVPFYMLQVFDRVLSSGSIETLLLLTLVATTALLTSAFLETIRSRLLMRLANRLYGLWARQLLTENGAGFSGKGFSRLRDLGEIKQFVGNGGLVPLLDFPWIPLYFIVLFLFNPIFAWAALIGGLVIAAIIALSEMRTRKGVDTAVAANAQSTLQADLLTKSADTIRALGMTERLAERWQSQAFLGLRQVHGVASRLAASGAAARFVRMTLQISVLGGAAFLVTRGELTPGVMIAGSILITRALGPLESMIGGWQTIVSSGKAFNRLQTSLESQQPAPPRAVSRPAGKVVLDRVTVIKNRQTLLNNVSLLINPGELVAIEGPCGAGKSVLARTILGLVQPTLGKVFIDGAETAQLNPDELGQYLGYMAQDAPLFEGSIGENIGRMDPAADPEQISMAGRRAYAHERILRLPDAYETKVGGMAEPLARGIQQQVALARTLYGDPRIVVLDEPEVHLDAEGETALLKTLSTMKRTDITTIVITHRPQIMSAADRVIRLRNGVVHAFGSPKDILPELLESKPEPTRDPALIEGRGKRIPESPTAAEAQVGHTPPPSASTTSDRAPAQAVSGPVVHADSNTAQSATSERQHPVTDAPSSQRRKPPAPERREPPKWPDRTILKQSRAAAQAEQLTLSVWLDPQQGALGAWIEQVHAKAGERYLSRLRRRLSPLLEQQLQNIDETTITEWRGARLGEGQGTTIERAMLKRRFDSDLKALRDCLIRAVEWEVLPGHVLVSKQAVASDQSVQRSRS